MRRNGEEGNHPHMEPAEYALMDQAEARMWWYRALHARLLDTLADVRGAVLDAGCGTGGFLALLGRHRPDLLRLGVEWHGPAAQRAREKAGALVSRGSVNALPFRDGSIQAVVMADVLCHAAVDPTMALAEAWRVLEARGRVIVNMPAYRWLFSAHDRRVQNARRLSAPETRRLLHDAGFRRIRVRYWNGLLLPLMILQRKLIARGESVSDVAPFPPWLDAMLHGMTRLERRIPFPLPVGGSVLAVAEKP